MITDEIVPILEGLDEYNMTEVGFLTTLDFKLFRVLWLVEIFTYQYLFEIRF